MRSLRNGNAHCPRRGRVVPCPILTLVLLLSATTASAQLLINELLAAPASDWNGDGEVDFKNDEWVEILNAGTAPVDLTGLYLKDASGDAYHYGFEGVLLPGEVRLVLGSDAVAWQAANDAGSTGLSLNNSGDTPGAVARHCRSSGTGSRRHGADPRARRGERSCHGPPSRHPGLGTLRRTQWLRG